jgi:hypothetical protein
LIRKCVRDRSISVTQIGGVSFIKVSQILRDTAVDLLDLFSDPTFVENPVLARSSAEFRTINGYEPGRE